MINAQKNSCGNQAGKVELQMSIIKVSEEKCVGCNACVRACPASEANVAQLDRSEERRVGKECRL